MSKLTLANVTLAPFTLKKVASYFVFSSSLLLTMILTSGHVLAQTNEVHSTHQEAMKKKVTDETSPGPKAQANMPVDHSMMEHGDAIEAQGHMEQADMPMDHSKMNSSEVDHSTMDHSKMNTSKQGMGNMQTQGGDVPANARDPNAYSGGFTLTEGPYAMAGPRQLKLADEHRFMAIIVDRLEYNLDSNTTVFEMQGWYGATYDRLVIKAEGDINKGDLEESQTEFLWGHAVSAYWDTQLGISLDYNGEGENRQWLALGMQGLAPYWFELDFTAYLGSNGRTALSAQAEYELMISQRVVLQSSVELLAYGKGDEINGIGKGVASMSVGMRLRYEFSRQFAPYIGIQYAGKYGETADLANANGLSTDETSVVAGVRFWF